MSVPKLRAMMIAGAVVALALPAQAGFEAHAVASTASDSMQALSTASPSPSSARSAPAPSPSAVASTVGLDDRAGDVQLPGGDNGQPNIVLLMIDDFPAMDTRVFERLPNIKALFLDQGISFSNYWANFSLCCPGRAAVLTGQTAAHNGVIKNDARLLDPRATIATELQAAGYHTLIAGKYLNKTASLTDKTPDGWDAVAIKDDGPYYDYPVWINGIKEKHGHLLTDYSTRVMADHGIQLLREAPIDQPVFAFLTPNATHGGWDETYTKDAKLPAVEARYRGDPRCVGIPNWKPASYNEKDVSDKPDYVKQLAPVAYPDGWPLKKACEALLSVDDWLGMTIDELKAQQRYANTLFLLTVDNGMGWGAHRIAGKVAPYTAQMPLYISWPAVLGDSLPTVNDTLLTNVDIAPTLCEFGGCVMGPYPNGNGTDGQGFAGLIDAARFSSIPQRDSILMQGQGGIVPSFRAIMTGSNHRLGQWLMVKYLNGKGKELYRVSGGPCVAWTMGSPGDPCMLNNASGQNVKIRRKLLAELAREWQLPGVR